MRTAAIVARRRGGGGGWACSAADREGAAATLTSKSFATQKLMQMDVKCKFTARNEDYFIHVIRKAITIMPRPEQKKYIYESVANFIHACSPLFRAKRFNSTSPPPSWGTLLAHANCRAEKSLNEFHSALRNWKCFWTVLCWDTFNLSQLR